MSALSAAVSGVGVASQGVALAANNVANVNSDGYRAKRLQREELPQGGVREAGVQETGESAVPGGSNVDLAAEAIALKTDSVTYQASLKVVKAQEDMIGTALDMKA